MNREIKFRVWDGNNKSFDYPNVIELDCGIEYQQYTGLKDKNGTEIYEGDVLKVLDDIVTVFFNESMGSWDYEYIGGDCESMVPQESCYNPIDFEVIGNIHENKEILK